MRADLCLNGSCSHEPYDRRCSDPDYGDQPCCGLRVHGEDIGSDDECYHDEECRMVSR